MVRYNCKEIFVIKSKEVHGEESFSYDSITEGDIKNYLSKVSLQCIVCDIIFHITINKHINEKRGCPLCSGSKFTTTHFSKKLLIRESNLIYGENKFNFDNTNKLDVVSGQSRIDILCLICNYTFICSVDNHIIDKSGCPNCKSDDEYEKLLYRESLINRSIEIHGEKTFDYSLIIAEKYDNIFASISIKCKNCEKISEVSITSHIHDGEKCINCNLKLPWTYSRFIYCCRKIHKNLYEYPIIPQKDIINKTTLLSINCCRCGNNFSKTVSSHIYGKSGCTICSGMERINLNKLILCGRKIHGDIYDYSKMDYSIITVNTRLQIKCKKCDSLFNQTYDVHIHSRCGCPSCFGNKKWTLESFKSKAKELHGDLYDYSKIIEIANISQKFNVKCLECSNYWETTIDNHIHRKRGCPCKGHVRWTLELFLIRASQIHYDLYDYSEITNSHIQGWDSHVPIICNKCSYKWNPSINDHINGKNGCPFCANNLKWTLEKFKNRAAEIHRNKYNYSLISEDDIKGRHSHLKISCNKCNFVWNQMLSVHITCRSGCPQCVSRRRWSLDKLLLRASSVHNDMYDYSFISSTDITHKDSRITINCKKCDSKWVTTPDVHINIGCGCPTCSGSKGERTVAEVLKQKFNISFMSQYGIKELPLKRYDFAFNVIINDKLTAWIIEYDGLQHFKYTDFFHETPQIFVENQMVDILKTQTAIRNGFNVIRIDHTVKNYQDILNNIINAFYLNAKIYVTNKDMYSYILDHIRFD